MNAPVIEGDLVALREGGAGIIRLNRPKAINAVTLEMFRDIDKALDTYYLTLELIVALRWQSAYARWPAVALYIYRGIGVILFEITHARIMLFIFPNLFENWWLYVVAVAQFWPRLYPRSAKTVAIPLFILLIPKMAQEYVLHYAELEPWDWIKHHVLRTS